MPNKYNHTIKEELDGSDFLELESLERDESSRMLLLNDPDFTQPPWMKGLTQGDVNAMYQLGLSKNGLLAEIKKIFDQAYHIGLQEAQELTKGKSLDIFSNPSRRK